MLPPGVNVSQGFAANCVMFSYQDISLSFIFFWNNLTDQSQWEVFYLNFYGLILNISVNINEHLSDNYHNINFIHITPPFVGSYHHSNH